MVILAKTIFSNTIFSKSKSSYWFSIRFRSILTKGNDLVLFSICFCFILRKIYHSKIFNLKHVKKLCSKKNPCKKKRFEKIGLKKITLSFSNYQFFEYLFFETYFSRDFFGTIYFFWNNNFRNQFFTYFRNHVFRNQDC